MALHGLTAITLGVPDVDEVAKYYEEFGLSPSATRSDAAARVFATADGGDQLRLVSAPRRRLLEINVGTDDSDDLDRVQRNLADLDIAAQREPDSLRVTDPNSALQVTVAVAPRITQA